MPPSLQAVVVLHLALRARLGVPEGFSIVLTNPTSRSGPVEARVEPSPQGRTGGR